MRPRALVVFGEEDQTYGRFETDIFVEENAYFELGIFSARVVRSYYEEQLVITAGVEKEWDAALVRPFLWKVNGGQCSLEEFGYMHDNKLTEDFAISVKPGEYHRFGYETDGKQKNNKRYEYGMCRKCGCRVPFGHQGRNAET